MGETTNQIEAHIEETRKHLGSNIRALEWKVKSATDWKHYFRRRPMIMIGAAFGGGVVLAAMLGRGKRQSSLYARPRPWRLA